MCEGGIGAYRETGGGRGLRGVEDLHSPAWLSLSLPWPRCCLSTIFAKSWASACLMSLPLPHPMPVCLSVFFFLSRGVRGGGMEGGEGRREAGMCAVLHVGGASLSGLLLLKSCSWGIRCLGRPVCLLSRLESSITSRNMQMHMQGIK